jgi:hypothetical protein
MALMEGLNRPLQRLVVGAVGGEEVRRRRVKGDSGPGRGINRFGSEVEIG